MNFRLNSTFNDFQIHSRENFSSIVRTGWKLLMLLHIRTIYFYRACLVYAAELSRQVRWDTSLSHNIGVQQLQEGTSYQVVGESLPVPFNSSLISEVGSLGCPTYSRGGGGQCCMSIYSIALYDTITRGKLSINLETPNQHLNGLL